MIFYYLLAFIIILYLLRGYYTIFKTGVPTIASSRAMQRAMIGILQKELSDRPATIVDLGSGSGHLSWRLARLFTQAQVIGIELSPLPFFCGLMRKILLGPRNLHYRRQDLRTYDCTAAHAVIVYLRGAAVMEGVGNKLRAELKPGALILCNETALRGDWQPVKIHAVGLLQCKLYLYRR
jgi:SAM-dependent methyltransferase